MMMKTPQPPQEELVYGLKRAGPRNFDKFMIRNYFEPKLKDFDFASRPVRDVYYLPLDEIIALEVSGESSEDGTIS